MTHEIIDILLTPPDIQYIHSPPVFVNPQPKSQHCRLRCDGFSWLLIPARTMRAANLFDLLCENTGVMLLKAFLPGRYAFVNLQKTAGRLLFARGQVSMGTCKPLLELLKSFRKRNNSSGLLRAWIRALYRSEKHHRI